MAALAAKVSGYVSKIHVDLGDVVTKGQVLIELSVPELDAEGRQKAALVAQATLAVRQARQGLDTAAAQVATADALVLEATAGVKRAEANRDRWASESKRLAELVAKAVVDRQTYEEARNQAKSAEAALDEVQAKVGTSVAMLRRWRAEHESAKLDVLASEAKLAVAVAEHDRVKELIDFKTIRAPFDGVVSRRSIDVGNLVQTSLGELLTVMVLNKVRVVVDVPEADSVLVRRGDKVIVKAMALEGREFASVVSRTAASLDPQSRTLRVEIDLDNKDGMLRPGMYATASIGVDLAPVRALPAKALTKAGETNAAFAVRDGKAVRVRLKAGRSDGTFTEVVEVQRTDGTWTAVTGDDAFIANPPGSLVDGQAVEVVK